ncbi:MAG TPA: LamG-like jellyroll fold domain-containing protein [Gemmataceae bacterium]|nr:LamG-like jellyroll fold domain-containing protein [Gemmataceae bacterium]
MRTDRLIGTITILLGTAGFTPAQVVVATYGFNNSYAADQGGVPALTPYAPGTGTLSFATDTVNVGTQSVTRPVLIRGGGNGASQPDQAGAELTTSSLLSNPNVYSVEMVFSMDGTGGYQRILNTNNASDDGLYAINDRVSIYNNGDQTGSGIFTYGPSTYHHLALTYDGTTAKEYLDGVPDVTQSSTVMANPNNLMRFFLDNAGSTSTNEFGPGRVALIRLWDGVLSDSQVAGLAAAPFAAVPEPGTMVLTGAVAVGAFIARRRRQPV